MESSSQTERPKRNVHYSIGVAVLVLAGAGIILAMGRVGTSNDTDRPVAQRSVSSAPPAAPTATELQSIPTVRTINPSEAKVLIESKAGDSAFVILDVRTAEEYASGHLKDSQNVDYYAADVRDRIAGLDRAKTYLAYCRTGRRSAEFTKLMQEAGFRSVYDLAGGITAWTGAGLPVE